MREMILKRNIRENVLLMIIVYCALMADTAVARVGGGKLRSKFLLIFSSVYMVVI